MDDIERSLHEVLRGANRTRRDLVQELVSDLEQIEGKAAVLRQGRNSPYQAVAIQLRNLLLKGRRGLVHRTLPAATQHAFCRPTAESPSPGKRPDPGKPGIALFDARGFLRLQTAGGSHIELAFDSHAEPLPLERWLGQWMIRPDITVRNLMHSVANEDVVHTLEQIIPAIQRAEGFLVSERPFERRVPAMAVVAIGEYVARRLLELVAEMEASSGNSN